MKPLEAMAIDDPLDICMNCGKSWGKHKAAHPITNLSYCDKFDVDKPHQTHWRPAPTETDAKAMLKQISDSHET